MAGASEQMIRNRIRSMKGTGQITRAMELVAASKLRAAQEQIGRVRPYYKTLYETVQAVAASSREGQIPYFREGEGDKRLYVVIAGDRGLAGGYNSNVLKRFAPLLQEKNATVFPVGRKAVEFFYGSADAPEGGKYMRGEGVSVGDCYTLANVLTQRYWKGEYRQIAVIYTKFVSVLSQIPEMLTLLPIATSGEKEGSEIPGNMLFDPDAKEVLDRLVPEYLGGILYGALCESRAAEQAARRVAMDAAQKNAEEMIRKLCLQYNRVRQAAITREITEIVAGAGTEE